VIFMKFTVSCLLGIFTYFFGNFDFLFSSVFVLFGIHFLLAFFSDIKMNRFKFRNLLLRFFKFFGYLSLLVIAVILDSFFSFSGTIRNILLTSFLYHEIVSVLQYCISFGLRIPTIVFSSLQKLLDQLPKETIENLDNEKK